MEETNYYKIIGVYPSDSMEYIEKQAKLKIIGIKAALARKNYKILDVSTDTDDARLKQIVIEKIAEIEQAKEILLNPKTRKEFDVKTYGKSYLKRKRRKRDPKKYEKLKAFLGKKEDVTTAIVYAIGILIAAFIWFIVLPDGSSERLTTTASTVYFNSEVDELNKRADEIRKGRWQGVDAHIKAANLYQQVLSLESHNKHALFWLAYSLFHSKQYKASLRAYDKLLQKYPNHKWGHEYRKEAYNYIQSQNLINH
ncbi:hypothetical protein THIOM_004900 [Candidatus Thiomargarita nelsonii]|uniref:Uncharacterized protein n=1 Tax=Candidatus Thiomargarita nelsonii TaxID=1003181 RepID=A0A176RUS5_9GAMM|nr:hypothetical protein THIOM_004900 [Candidatus Thiomargarita nelsonii]